MTTAAAADQRRSPTTSAASSVALRCSSTPAAHVDRIRRQIEEDLKHID